MVNGISMVARNQWYFQLVVSFLFKEKKIRVKREEKRGRGSKTFFQESKEISKE